MQHEFRHALSSAKFFRSIGLVPLPSRMDEKRPTLCEFKCYQHDPVPVGLYQPDQWQTTNLQLMTGALTSGPTKIIVVDLDGPEAVGAWKRLCARKGYTHKGIWISRTGGGGIHLYYRLPVGTASCESRLLWGLYDPRGGQSGSGGWVNHKEIRLLGDTSLVVAPPSKHVKTGKDYQWIGKWSPAVFALPVEAPEWLLSEPGLETPTTAIKPSKSATSGYRPHSGESSRDTVLRSMTPDRKLALAISWGLRVRGGAHSRQAWVSCHALDREDETPSAGFCPSTGVYHDFGGSQLKLSLFDLSVALGAHRTWLDAMHEAQDSVMSVAS